MKANAAPFGPWSHQAPPGHFSRPESGGFPLGPVGSPGPQPHNPAQPHGFCVFLARVPPMVVFPFNCAGIISPSAPVEKPGPTKSTLGAFGSFDSAPLQPARPPCGPPRPGAPVLDRRGFRNRGEAVSAGCQKHTAPEIYCGPRQSKSPRPAIWRFENVDQDAKAICRARPTSESSNRFPMMI